MKPTNEDEDDRRVELRMIDRGDQTVPELLIDGERVAYGRLFDGTYFLLDNAYEWGDDLRSLGVRLAHHRRKPDGELSTSSGGDVGEDP